jgi:lipoprotein NlpD
VAAALAAASLLGGCYALLEGQPVEPQRSPANGRAGPSTGAQRTALPVQGRVDEPKDALPAGKGQQPFGPDQRPRSYVVRKGDTLYAIALEYGLDYRELAGWNALPDSDRIVVGQVLQLTPPDPADAPVVRATRVGSDISVEPLSPELQGPSQDGARGPEPPGKTAATPVVHALPVLAEPKARVIPFSDKALAQLHAPAPQASAQAVPAPSPERQEARPGTEQGAAGRVPVESNADEIDWIWPATGPVVYRFGERGARKGLGIGGAVGQTVGAAAPGRVVYSGSGLRGYGKLVILKHNEAFFSVYAHNNALLVKEGEQVKRGQPIAEMGSSDADTVALHFEIRRFGQPVDPLAGLLPPR